MPQPITPDPAPSADPAPGPPPTGVRRAIQRAVPRGDFARGTLVIASATGLGQFVGILASPIVTRLYQPDEFGAFGVVASILAICITIASLSYELAVPLPEWKSDALAVVALSCLLAVLIGAVSGVIVFMLGDALVGSSGVDPAWIALAVALGTTLGGVNTALSMLAVRDKAYRVLGVNRFTQSVVTAGSQVGFGLLGAGSGGLILGSLLGGVASLARLAWSLFHGTGVSLRSVDRHQLGRVSRRYRRFAFLSAPSSLLNTIGLQAPLLLMVALYGPAVGGQFALAQRTITLPTALLTGAIGQTFTGEAAEQVRIGPAALRRLFVRTTKALATIGIAPVTIAAILSPFIFGIVFGRDWTEAGLYASALAPMYFMQFVANPTGSTLDVLERQDLHLGREIVRIILVSVAVVGSWALGLSALLAVVAISIAGTTTYVMYAGVSWWAIVAHARRQEAAEGP